MEKMDDLAAASSAHLLQKVGLILESEGVRWATIGALAIAYHGWVRASLDADALITFKGSTTDMERITLKFKSKTWSVDSRIGDEDDPLGFVIRIKDEFANQVDLIGGIRKLDSGFFDRAIPSDMEGLSLRISSPEDVVALKIFAGGPKDMEDAYGVMEVIGTSLNRELLLQLCKRFGSIEAATCENLFKKLDQAI